MNRLLLVLTFCPLFLSCSKEPGVTAPEEPRLHALTYNAGLANSETISFQYDAAGRIVSLQSAEIGAAAEVSYAANQVLITSESETLGIDQTIRLIVDGSGRLTRRLEGNIHRDEPTNPVGEVHYVSDTTDYYYDSDGLLIRSEGKRHDTTRTGTDGTFVREIHNSYTTTYVNANKNLASLKTVFNFVDMNNHIYYTNEDSYVFEYDKHYENKLNFKNALFNEISLFQEYPFPIQGNYSMLPNKVTHTETHKDETGDPLFSNTYGYNTTISFDAKGFVNKIESDATDSAPLTLMYE